MKKLFFLLCFLISSVLSSHEDINIFIQTLSPSQKELLDSFFRHIIKNSFSGYVLYGDKPICIESYCLSPDTGAVSGFGDIPALLQEGTNLWESFKLPVEDKNYFFLMFNAHSHRHFVCINRRAFIQAVNGNLSLFRYVLGPTLTAENLLNELILKKEQFYDLLKNDNVLLGILLGYGTQNALLFSRLEYITDAFKDDRREDFPLISHKDRQGLSTLPVAQIKRPSLGFLSLEDEIDSIKKTEVISRNLAPFDSYKIPYFGCDSFTEETKSLISIYKKNRKEIVKYFDSDDFLKQPLSKFFTTTSCTLDIPKVPPSPALFLPEKQEALLAEKACEELRREKFFQESYYEDFIRGIFTSEKNQEIANRENPFHQLWEIYLLESKLEPHENLKKSEAYFKTLADDKNITCLIQNKLYYKKVVEGSGPPASSKVRIASLLFTYRISDDPEIYHGSINKEKVEYFIPGIALALNGMRRGEQREIHIHPEYGYGEGSYLPPNITFIAKIELVDFEEGDQEAIFFPLKKFTQHDYNDLFRKLEELNKKRFFESGFDFWNHYKKTMNYEAFQKHFNMSIQK